MQFIARLLGKLIFCVGIMISVVSCVLGSVVGQGTGLPFVGILLVVTGGVIWYRTSTRACPGCAWRMPYQARRCSHCGAQVEN